MNATGDHFVIRCIRPRTVGRPSAEASRPAVSESLAATNDNRRCMPAAADLGVTDEQRWRVDAALGVAEWAPWDLRRKG